jgi:hypothetical protein
MGQFFYREAQDQTAGNTVPTPEAPGLSVPREFLVCTLDALQTHVHGHFCDLVFNLDEMSVSECEERKSKLSLSRST